MKEIWLNHAETLEQKAKREFAITGIVNNDLFNKIVNLKKVASLCE